MVITYPKEGKYPKYFIECLYFLRFDISEIKYGSSTDAILLQNHNNAKFTDEQKDGIQKIIAYFGCREKDPHQRIKTSFRQHVCSFSHNFNGNVL